MCGFRLYISADEQLNKIFAIIGSPQDSDMEDLRKLQTAPKTLGDVPARRFHCPNHADFAAADILNEMRQPPYAAAALDFRTVFAHAPPPSVDLLSKMLRFSASSRISMFDARGHRFHEDSHVSAGAASVAAAAQFSSVCEEQVVRL